MQNKFIGIILAAGRGSRMLGETSNKPKCMTKLKGSITLLDVQIKSMQEAGIEEIFIVTGYKNQKIKNKKIKKIHNKKWKNSNMVYSLLRANKLLLKNNCIISYSDIIYEYKIISKLLKYYKRNLSISYDNKWKNLWEKRFTDPLSDAESFRLNKNNDLLNIGQKETNIKKIQGQFMGLLKTTPEEWRKVLKYLNNLNKKTVQNLQSTQLLNELIKKKIIRIKCVKNQGKWCEVDNQSDLKIARSIFKYG